MILYIFRIYSTYTQCGAHKGKDTAVVIRLHDYWKKRWHSSYLKISRMVVIPCLLLYSLTFLPVVRISAHRGRQVWILHAIATASFGFLYHKLDRLFSFIHQTLNPLLSQFLAPRFPGYYLRCFDANPFFLSIFNRHIVESPFQDYFSVFLSVLRTFHFRSGTLTCLFKKGFSSCVRERLAGIPCRPLFVAVLYFSLVSPSLSLSSLGEEAPGLPTFTSSAASRFLSKDSLFPDRSKSVQHCIISARYQCEIPGESATTCVRSGSMEKASGALTGSRVSRGAPCTTARGKGEASACTSGFKGSLQGNCFRLISCKLSRAGEILSDASALSFSIGLFWSSALIIKGVQQSAYSSSKSLIHLQANKGGSGLVSIRGAHSSYPLFSAAVNPAYACNTIGFLARIVYVPVFFKCRKRVRTSPAVFSRKARGTRSSLPDVSLQPPCSSCVSVLPTNVGEAALIFTHRRSEMLERFTASPLSRLYFSHSPTAGFMKATQWKGPIGSHTLGQNRSWRRPVETRTAQEKQVDTPYDIQQGARGGPYARRHEQAAAGRTQLHALLLSRRRLKIHDADKIHKVLRRGVPLRKTMTVTTTADAAATVEAEGVSVAASSLPSSTQLSAYSVKYLDVSGNVHLPGHIFNPVKVLQFRKLLDRLLNPSFFPPLSDADGGSLLRFLSTHARSRNDDAVSSYAAVAYQLRRVVSALLSTVHPVLLCMYTRWLRLQEQPRTTPMHTANTTAESSRRQNSCVSPLKFSSVSSASIPVLSSFSSLPAPSSRMPSASSSTYPAHKPQQHRIIACLDTELQSSKGESVLTAGLPSAATAVRSTAGVVNCSERLALAIEGGAMRGCVTAGMAAALHHMGYADVFDAVYGSSAGSLVGAYFLSRQLPYEGAQVYYDWLPYMGKKFLDMKRLGKGLGLGFLLDADVLGFIKKKNGSPLINLDVLLHDVVQRRQPLDWNKFKRQDQYQPLKVIASGLHSQRAVILESAAGNFNSYSTFLNCIRASMLMPGLAGPVVHVHMLSPSCTKTSIIDSSTRVDTSGSDKARSGLTSSILSRSAAETTTSATSSTVQPSSSVNAAAAAAVVDAASSSLDHSPGATPVAISHHTITSFAATDFSSSEGKKDPSSAVSAADTEFVATTGGSAYSSFVSGSAPSASSVTPPPLSFSSSPSASYISEPLADALLYEPIPYRSALVQGYNRILVLRSRPDGLRVGRLSGLEAAIENRVASRFFGETHLRHVYEYVKQRQHRILYMDDMLLLNEASNSRKLLRVIEELGPQHRQRGGNVQELTEQEGEQQQALDGYAFAVSLPRGCAEIAKTSLKRSKILQGIRDGFARLYDVLVPDPAQRGKGMEEALKVFPEDLPRVTDTLMATGGEAAARVQRLPPVYDDSAEKQQVEAGQLGRYVLQAALAQAPQLISCNSSVLFASAKRAASCVASDAAAVRDSCSSVTRANDRTSACNANFPEHQHRPNV